MKTVLVTGGCGFIGHHLAKRLTMNAEHSVYVLDNLSGVGADKRETELRSFPGITMVGRGQNVEVSLLNLLDGNGYPTKFDVIYHLAAVSRTMPAIDNPVRCMYTNVMGTVEVLELARNIRCPRVVVSSSNVVYAANNPYKASKLAMEEACRSYHETYGLSVVCLRYSNVYGPGFAEHDQACLASMRDSLVKHGYLEITGDFTHVDDIVRGNLLAAGSDYSGTVDLCTGVNWSMNRASNMLRDCAPQEWALQFKHLRGPGGGGHTRYVGDRQGDFKHIIQDPNPAKEILGWEAAKTFDQNVKDVWRY